MRPFEQKVADKFLSEISDSEEKAKITPWLYGYLALFPMYQDMLREAFDLILSIEPNQEEFKKLKYPPKEYSEKTDASPYYLNRNFPVRTLKKLFLKVLDFLESNHLVLLKRNKIKIRSLENFIKFKMVIDAYESDLLKALFDKSPFSLNRTLEYNPNTLEMLIDDKIIHKLQDHSPAKKLISFCWDNAEKTLSYKEIKRAMNFRIGIFRPKQWIREIDLELMNFFEFPRSRTLILRKTIQNSRKK